MYGQNIISPKTVFIYLLTHKDATIHDQNSCECNPLVAAIKTHILNTTFFDKKISINGRSVTLKEQKRKGTLTDGLVSQLACGC